jgi:filamentous hemagglutinin family protein
MNVTLANNTVIDWGKGTDFNKTGVAGFNIGSAATVNFTGAFGALNIDSTGNPSQIFGALNSAGNLYVANTNGIIVGATASIASTAGQVGLIANTLASSTGATFDGSASAASMEFAGAGGNVTVLAPTTGTGISGTTVLVSGGNVNIDLSALTGGTATVQAGVMNSTSGFSHDSTSAVLTATGDLGGATLTSFASAGDASTSGTLALGSNARVDGTLTNTGDLTLDATGFAIDGALVNNKTATQAADASVGSLVNNGAYDGATFNLTTTDGGITNNAAMSGIGDAEINGGDFVNNGQFTSSGGLDVYGGGNVVNNGDATLSWVDINEGGNFTNACTMDLANSVYVVNGNIANSGKLSVDSYLETASDSTAGMGFTKAADYSITNTGTVTATGGSLTLSANSDNWGDHNGTANDSTGSVKNTGILRVGTAGNLNLNAYNDVNLAGAVQAKSGTSYKALSATNMLGNLDIAAGNYDGTVLSTDGVATVATDLFAAGVSARGNQVKLMSNITADDHVEVIAGAKSDTDYAVRVAAGKTVSAGDWIRVDGDQAGDESNVILQGTLEGQRIDFGSVNAVSDVFTGPAGSLSLFDDGLGAHLGFNFTGAVKTVPYNNTPTNFRYNGLNVVTDGSVLGLTLNPVDYLTSGTSTGSAVNILVNGPVALTSPVAPTVGAGDTAVTGVTNIPNTHLVLQSSGNISTVGNFYWPGYVYLGTVAADADGNALPGTLGFGAITTGGYFNNVLPGDVSGASGIHFITQIPMTLGGDVVTNANAWVNFGTDLLTQGYANGVLPTGAFGFFGGVNTVGTVVSYDELDPSMFHTHAPTAAK